MGTFRIGSIDKMKNIANIMDYYVTETKSKSDELNTSIEALKTIADGNGIGESLTKLSDSVSATNSKATKLLTDISEFINKQAESYAANEAAAKSGASDVQNTLNEISG